MEQKGHTNMEKIRLTQTIAKCIRSASELQISDEQAIDLALAAIASADALYEEGENPEDFSEERAGDRDWEVPHSCFNLPDAIELLQLGEYEAAKIYYAESGKN